MERNKRCDGNKKGLSLSSKLKAKMEKDSLKCNPSHSKETSTLASENIHRKRYVSGKGNGGPSKKQVKAQVLPDPSHNVETVSSTNPSPGEGAKTDRDSASDKLDEVSDGLALTLDDMISSMDEKDDVVGPVEEKCDPDSPAISDICHGNENKDVESDQSKESCPTKSSADVTSPVEGEGTDCLSNKDSTSVCAENREEQKGSDDFDEAADSNEKPKSMKNKEDMRTNFTINLTDEAKDLIRELAQAAVDGKPPTVSRLKWLTVDALEQIIRYNDRPVYQLGNHVQLAAVVADYMKNGVPPRCPKCNKGALRFSNGKKKYGKKYYWCPGFSPNGYHFFGCNFKAPREEITRKPFIYPE